MKITFISPYFPNIWESLSIGYIASYCKENYSGNLDMNFFHGSFDSEDVMVREASKSDMVAFSCTTPTYENGVRIAKKIKNTNKDVITVLGGWHATTLWHSIDGVFDYIVVGEGEDSFLEILEGRSLGNGIFQEFKDLPWPDRKLIKQERTLDLCEEMCGERIASFQSRRGCPMNCSMCSESSMTMPHADVRVRDPDDLLDEIEYVCKTYEITRFKFLDPTWCYPKTASVDFCEKKIKRNVKMSWEAMVHASFLTKDLMKLMKDSGCVQMNVGCESGSQKILNAIRKGTTPAQIRKVFKWGNELDLDMRAFFMLGVDEESEETIEQTKQLIRDIKPSVFSMTLLTPYPGSDYYKSEYAGIDWSVCDEYTNDFWYTKNFTNQELKERIKEFNREFHDILVSHQKDNI